VRTGDDVVLDPVVRQNLIRGPVSFARRKIDVVTVIA
jgi:hypothetical protein